MLQIHEEVKKLHLYEKNDLVLQLRRCSKSCPANIAEGWAKRRYIKEFMKHLEIAIGSANEMEVHIDTVCDLGYWSSELCTNLTKRYNILGAKLKRLQKNWRTF